MPYDFIKYTTDKIGEINSKRCSIEEAKPYSGYFKNLFIYSVQYLMQSRNLTIDDIENQYNTNMQKEIQTSTKSTINVMNGYVMVFNCLGELKRSMEEDKEILLPNINRTSTDLKKDKFIDIPTIKYLSQQYHTAVNNNDLDNANFFDTILNYSIYQTGATAQEISDNMISSSIAFEPNEVALISERLSELSL